MGKFVSLSMLKNYSPSLVNRDDSGDAKQVVVGGVNRSRISSQCLKRAVREEIGNRGITTAHLEDLVEQILSDECAKGTISESDIETIGKAVCCEDVLNCDWSKRASKSKDKKDDDGKGRTVNQVNMREIASVVDVAIKNKDAKQKELVKSIRNALNDVRISTDKAMFGTMATSGVIETVDGAVQVAQTFSIDEYIPEDDFIVAKFSAENADDFDPFFGSYKKFENDNMRKTGSETLASSCLHSNTMLTCTSVNVTELKRNLSSSIQHTKIDADDVNSDVAKSVCDYIETVITTEPSAKQNAMSAHSVPSVVYIEVIEDGAVKYPQGSFEKIVRRTESDSVSEIGIKRISEFAADDTFRTGTIKKYVMLSAPYKSLENMFTNSGVTVIKNLGDLRTILTGDVLELV